jgi:Response regulator containing CheY-like receiver domain and AraC-type DNA-binding domain
MKLEIGGAILITLVVEDEKVIRKGIVSKVQWNKFGIEEVYEAQNGEIGYSLILEKKPEIVILDICLPKLSGIELLRKMRDENIDSKVIILSGHDEFEYAQQAIKYGVDHYLLKPASAGQIEEVLSKLCELITKKKEKEEYYEQLGFKLKEMAPYFKSGFISSLVSGEFTSNDEINTLAPYLGIDLNRDCFIVAAFALDDLETQGNLEGNLLNRLQISELLSGIMEGTGGFADFSISGKGVLVLGRECENSARKDCFTLVDRLRESIYKNIPKKITAGIGNVVKGIDKIPFSYKQALTALENKFIDGGNKTYFIGDIELGSYDFVEYPYDEERNLVQSVKTTQKDKAIGCLDTIIGFLKSKKERYPTALAKSHLRQLVYYLLQLVYELGGEISDLYPNLNIDEHINGLSNIDEFRHFIGGFIEKLCEYIAKHRYIKHTSSIRKIILYIEENYAREDLSLERIADYVEMHPNYVSQLFKKETGEGLTSYICRYRIKKAQEIILNPSELKIVDVAFKVGFNDAHYFATCFKNIVGVSPSEYRQMHGK